MGSGMEQLVGGGRDAGGGGAARRVRLAEPGSVSTTSLLALGYLIVFGSLIAFTAYVWLLEHAPISTVATYAYVNPVVAVFLGLLFRNEPLTPRILLAAALIIGAGGHGQRPAARCRGGRTRGGCPGTGRRRGMTPITVSCQPDAGAWTCAVTVGDDPPRPTTRWLYAADLERLHPGARIQRRWYAPRSSSCWRGSRASRSCAASSW